MKINLKKINSLIIFIFLLFSVVFPGDILGMKKILLLILIIINIKIIYKSILMKKNLYFSFFSILFPLFLFLYSSLLTGNLVASFTRSFAPYIFIIWFIINYYKINFEKLFLLSVKFLMLVIVLIWLMDVLKISDVNYGFVNAFFYDYDMGYIGKSAEYPLYYKIFLKGSPLIIFLLFYYFSKKKVLKSILTFLVLGLTGTRANVLFPAAMISFYFISYSKFNRYSKYLLVCIVLFSLLIYNNEIATSLKTIFIDKSIASDLVRAGHLKGLIELFDENPFIIFIGSGMGSEFYSYGVSDYVDSIELSYLDLLRQMGLGFFTLFLIFIVYPFFIKKIGMYKKYAFICYLLIASTNPLLFSSTAYIAYIYMYTYSEKEDKIE